MAMKKRRMVAIYMTEQEIAALKALAKRHGLPISTLVRLIVVNPDFAKYVIDTVEKGIDETQGKKKGKE